MIRLTSNPYEHIHPWRTFDLIISYHIVHNSEGDISREQIAYISPCHAMPCPSSMFASLCWISILHSSYHPRTHVPTHSFINNPQHPLSLPLPLSLPPTLPQYPLRPRPALLPAMFAQMPAFDLLPAGAQHAFVVGLLLGAGVEAAVDGGVDGAAEGFADALGGTGEG